MCINNNLFLELQYKIDVPDTIPAFKKPIKLVYNCITILKHQIWFDTNQKHIEIYVSALPGGDETMLHTVCIVVFWRMAISDIPVPICWRIHRRSYLTTVGWRIRGRLYPTMVDVVSRGIPHSESVNTFHFRDLSLFDGSLIKYTLSVVWLFRVQTYDQHFEQVCNSTYCISIAIVGMCAMLKVSL